MKRYNFSDQNLEQLWTESGHKVASSLFHSSVLETSASQQCRLILLVTEFNDGPLHGLDHRIIEQAIKIVETPLLGSKSDPNSGEVAVAGMAYQAFSTLGQIFGINLKPALHVGVQLLNVSGDSRSTGRQPR